MTRSVLICFHKYTLFGDEFYEPLLDLFLKQMQKFKDEYDHIYLIDSNWNIDPKKIEGIKASVVKVNPHLRYYDAYKEVLPQVKEDLVFLMDDDTIIWKEGIIKEVFGLLEENYDVVAVYNNIGEYKTDKLNGKNKFAAYWFATKKDLLKRYLEIDWGPHMPHSETLGFLTEAILNDGLIPYEWPDDRSSVLFDGTTDNSQDHLEGGKGYYPHIRAGSVPAYLLAAKKYGDIKIYKDYLINQPRNEYLRQMAWYSMIIGMCGYLRSQALPLLEEVRGFLKDIGVSSDEWAKYSGLFKEYHGLS